MRIWDLHAHLTSLPGDTPPEKLKHLLTIADRMGIERLCVYMGTQFLQDPRPDELIEQNDEVLQAIEAYPDRAFGFVYLSAKYPAESLRELDRCVARGPMVGVKLWVAGRCDAESIDPIIERASALKAPIFQHTWQKTTGNLPGESTPADLALLAKRHPGAKLICGHTGGNWELGLRQVRDLANVWIDLAGSDPVQGFTEMAIREVGIDRILYGSDCPGRSFASQLAKVYGANLGEEEQEKILFRNLLGLLKPILDVKGRSIAS